jgi:heme-degrading monooxygenase HmoA
VLLWRTNAAGYDRNMIARMWRGYTSRENAGAYQAMLTPELLPGLSSLKGFRASYLLRRDSGNEVEFVTIILWDSIDDVRAVAGPDYETAVIPDERKRVLARWDEKAAHYEIVSRRPE